MTISTMLLRLVGADPEQKSVEARLKKNIEESEEQDSRLDSILERIEMMGRGARTKKDEMAKTIKDIRAESPVPAVYPEDEITARFGRAAR